MVLLFTDRADAGRRLAAALTDYADKAPVVLALPRGGVPVAAEICRALVAPLDLLMVRKIGVPTQPELALGAVVDGEKPEIVVNDDIAWRLRFDTARIAGLADAELAEIERRRARYARKGPPLAVSSRTVIVVDDGIATGATVRAALKGLRKKGARLVVLAVPVAPKDVIQRLAGEADAIVCLAEPEPFTAVGEVYRDFDQVSDETVTRLLAEFGGNDT